jgi:glutamyl-tRNA reductase
MAAALRSRGGSLLHPPLESLRSEAVKGPPHGLLEALKRLFQLQD